MRILFTGSGTGGHIFPIISVVREIKKIYNQNPENKDNLELYFLGAADFTKESLEKEGIKVKTIMAGKLRRYPSALNILDFFKIPIGIIQSLWHLYFWMPDVIFSKGGYGSIPVVLAGWLFWIPTLIHESDTVPGLANRLGSKLSKRIAISFNLTEKYFPPQKTALVGNPIRAEVIQACLAADQSAKERAKGVFKITSQKPIIFIIGGSQGAQKINQIVLSMLPQLLGKYEVIHQTGTKNYQEIEERFPEASRPADYHPFPFLEENQMGAAYLLADLVVSRAGAGSIFEIAACAKPSILIPLPKSAAEHQKENAFAYAQLGGAVVLDQDNLMPNLLLDKINRILEEPISVQKMKESAKKFSFPGAAQKIAQSLIEMGK